MGAATEEARRLRHSKMLAARGHQEHVLREAQMQAHADDPPEPQPLHAVVARCLEDWGVTNASDTEKNDKFCDWKPPAKSNGVDTGSSRDDDNGGDEHRVVSLTLLRNQAAAIAKRCHPA